MLEPCSPGGAWGGGLHKLSEVPSCSPCFQWAPGLGPSPGDEIHLSYDEYVLSVAWPFVQQERKPLQI